MSTFHQFVKRYVFVLDPIYVRFGSYRQVLSESDPQMCRDAIFDSEYFDPQAV